MNSDVENLPPHIIRLVYKEVTTLTADPPDGIKVFPKEEDLTDLQVTIEGLLPDQDLPPERGRQWRDLRQRAQERLDG
uniref:Ubiquitin conjugating enzyme E2 S n=1 Tax=Gorilla gorilla gorilla TaxID=9595 RepID=A0A2I2ZGI3_GORGO